MVIGSCSCIGVLVSFSISPFLCTSHVQQHPKKRKDEQVKSLFWSAAKSTTRNKFDKVMNKMKAANYSAWEYVTNIGVERWNRAYFQDHVKCHVFSSSIVECFNSVIKTLRDNPIDILVDKIRVKTISLMQKKKEKMRRESGAIIYPKILKRLNVLIVDSTSWHVASCGEISFEVTLRPQRFVVHLHDRKCTCRLWDLTGVPCVHACATIKAIKGRPEDYVHEYFTRECFFRAYDNEITPMSSSEFWPKIDHEPIKPPLLLKRPEGRPKKRRHKSSLEGKDPHKAKSKYGVIKCSKCGQFGHNKRSCKEAEHVYFLSFSHCI